MGAGLHGDALTAPRLTARDGVGVSACIVQRQALTFKRLFIEQPVLIVVERGVKTLRGAGGE